MLNEQLISLETKQKETEEKGGKSKCKKKKKYGKRKTRIS